MATVNEVVEHEDGGATINIEFTPEEMKLVMTYAVTNMIRAGIKLKENGELDESCYDNS